MTITRRQFWLLLGAETVALLALLGWILSQLGKLTEPSFLLVAAVIIVAGDLATALIMERFAPTDITLEPGEGAPRLGRAVADFDRDGNGVVLLRGERWNAQLQGAGPVRKGDAVSVVSRAGLTLVVKPHDLR